MALRVVIMVVLLGFGTAGFWLFNDHYKATLWLIFFIAAYPLALAFTVADPMRSSDLLKLYKMGLSQIPLLGKLLGAVSANDSDPPRAYRRKRLSKPPR